MPPVSDAGASNPVEQPPQQRRTGRGRIPALACGLALLIGVVWWWLPVPPLGPLVGGQPAVGGDAEGSSGSTAGSGAGGVKAVSLKAETTTSSTMTTMNSENCVLPTRSLVILGQSQHRLVQQVARELFSQLSESKKFTEVRYLPRGEPLSADTELPDVFVTLDQKSISEGGLPFAGTFDVTLLATFGTEPCHSNHSYSDELTPPLIEFFWNGEIHSRGTLLGVESPAAQYSSLAKELVKPLAEAILKTIDQLQSDQPPAPEGLADWILPSQTPPAWNVLSNWKAEQVARGTRVLTPGFAMWRIQTDRGFAELWEELSGELREAGWEVELQLAADSTHAQARRGSERVEFFVRSVGMHLPEESPGTTAQRTCWLRYIRRPTTDEYLAILQRLLAGDAPESAIVVLRRHWHLDRAAVEQYFERHPAVLWSSLERRAQWRMQDGKPEEARELVLQANAWQRILDDNSSTGPLQELAKKLELPELPRLPDPAEVKRLGLVDLREPTRVERKLVPGERLACLLKLETETQEYLLLRLTAHGLRNWQLEMKKLELHGNGSSSSTKTSVAVQSAARDAAWQPLLGIEGLRYRIEEGEPPSGFVIVIEHL